ncbi:MAG: GNAT family N-acetyltransferase [Elusimicrobia bacterium]|nr:GNAT family N-acetyltransferase [Elusimicrobiota bacterium]
MSDPLPRSRVKPILLDLRFPILTPRLLIRPAAPGDGPALYAAKVESLVELRRWMPWARVEMSVEESEQSCREAYLRCLAREDLRLYLFDRETRALVGGSGLHRIDWEQRIFEIGYWVRKTRVGAGYVTEAVNAIARYAFGPLEAKRVSIHCNASNLKSRAVAERLGFPLEGVLHNDDRAAGPEVSCRDHAIYARTSSEGLPPLDVSW